MKLRAVFNYPHDLSSGKSHSRLSSPPTPPLTLWFAAAPALASVVAPSPAAADAVAVAALAASAMAAFLDL